MTDEEILHELGTLCYPGHVDVTASVMEQVRRRPLLSAPSAWPKIRKAIASVAACALIAVVANITHIYIRDYNETQIGALMSEVYDYHADYFSTADDSYDLGAVECFYDEEDTFELK